MSDMLMATVLFLLPANLDPNVAVQSVISGATQSVRPACATCAVSISAVPAWARAGFKNPKISSLDLRPEAPGAMTHELRLTAVLFRGTRWSFASLRERYRKVAGVYAQCGVRLAEVTLVESDAWNDHLDMHGGDQPEVGVERSIAAALPEGIVRPLIFHVRSIEDGSLAFAGAPYYVPPGHPLYGMVFEAEEVPRADQAEDASYSTEAHELAHILGNIQQHSRGAASNLMSHPASARPNGVLTPAQCQEIRKSPLVRKL